MTPYQLCTACVMDTSDPGISFDQNGVCNHCQSAEKELPRYQFTPEQEKANLDQLVRTIRGDARGEYDSIVGLSGGVDSSYITHVARSLGLRPLMVHFDNGWNSEKSVSNIKKIIDACGFHLETYVINWPEFKDLQRSFFRAGVVDIELLTDHAILATMFKLRRKHNIKYILSGANYVTEHGMPSAWVWKKQDSTNIKAIQKKFGTRPIREFPILGTIQFQLIQRFNMGGTYLEPLNRINFNKDKAMETLTREYGWEYYGGKHYESVFTKFYQAHILPVKFGIDKRRVHLSALIRTKEISRDAALVELNKPLYTDLELRNDKAYVLKKLDFSEVEFDAMMREAPKSHRDYPNDEWILEAWMKFRPRLFARKT